MTTSEPGGARVPADPERLAEAELRSELARAEARAAELRHQLAEAERLRRRRAAYQAGRDLPCSWCGQDAEPTQACAEADPRGGQYGGYLTGEWVCRQLRPCRWAWLGRVSPADYRASITSTAPHGAVRTTKEIGRG